MKLYEWLRAEQVRRDTDEYPELRRIDFAAFDRKGDDLTRRKALMIRALESGAAWKSPHHLYWHIAGRCTAPVEVNLDTAWIEDDKSMPIVPVGDRAIREVRVFFTLHVPCRRCSACLRTRAALWRGRAQIEMRRACRTWFGTFTLSPENHYLMLARAGFDQPDIETEFKARHREISKEFTRYFKRLRKNSGAQIRYLLVAERHKNGLPHYHALIHESDCFRPVRHADLSAGWVLGYTRFKLVEGTQHAAYVSKYLSKDAVARVRASIRYGHHDL